MALLAAHLDGSWLVGALTDEAGAEGACVSRWEDVAAGRGAVALGHAAAPTCRRPYGLSLPEESDHILFSLWTSSAEALSRKGLR